MIAILGGLGAALSWAIATICSSRSSRLIGPTSVLAWVMIVGVVITAVPAAMVPSDLPSTGDFLLLLVYGASYTGGLLLAYRALTVGRVSIVTPIVSTEGAVAAVIAVLLGEALSLPLALTLGAIVVGVVLAGIERDPGEGSPTRLRPGDHARIPVVLAVAAALVFGVGLVVGAKLGASVPFAWIVLSARVVGTAVIALPLIARGRLRLTRETLPLVVVSGTLEAVGAWSYVFGAQDSIAVTAVLGAQFAVISSLIAFALFHERLARVQVIGVAVVVAGVTVLAVLPR